MLSPIQDSRRWSELEGLSSLKIRAAAEGPDGSIWFARREGLLLYDGTEIETLDLPREPVDAVQDVYVSHSGSAYFLGRGLLAVFEKGRWKTLSEAPVGLYLADVISETANGDVWVGMGSSLVRVRNAQLEAFEIGLDSIDACLVDGEDRLWVSDSQSGVVRVFAADSFRAGAELPAPLKEIPLEGSATAATQLFLDKDGMVWVIFPDEEGNCYRYDMERRELALSGLAEMRFLPGGGSISIVETPPGRFWFCVSRRLGELRGGQWRLHDVESLPLPTSYPYLIGLSGNRLLIGGHVSKTYIIDLSDRRWAEYQGLNFQCESPVGTKWFLSHDGRVVRHESQDDSWTAVSVEDGLIEAPNRLFASSDGVIWASGMHQGSAALAYRENGEWERRVYPAVAEVFSHLSPMEASDGSVFFGAGTPASELGRRRGGAVVFSKVEGSYKGVHVEPPLFPKRTSTIVERKGDGFWFGGYSLARRGGDVTLKLTQVERFDDNWIDHMLVDRENKLWLALWGLGVYRFDGTEWTLFFEPNGLASNQVVSLLSVGEGAMRGLWAATGDGLSRYDGRSWSNWEFSPDVAFRRENGTLFADSDEAIWLNYAYRAWLLEGHRDERYASNFRTLRYRAERSPPETTIVNSDTGVPEGGQISVAWKGTDPWFETPSRAIEYSWRLDDGEWSPYSRATRAVLSQLSGGSHRFEVRSRDRDWNVDPTPATVRLSVIMPVWKRPWFIVTALVLGGLIAFLILALVKARIRSAIAMEEFKLDFFTNISHELRNPLAVIVGPIESLLRGEPDAKSRGMLQLALSNARKMQGLIDQLLQFRKLELGKSTFRPTRGEIVGFVRDAVTADNPLSDAKGQRVSCSFEPDYYECAFDADKLQKIFDNLFSNAVKYTQEGGAIEVRMRIEEGHGPATCELQVIDNGIGIAPHEIDLVSKPFYQVKGGKGSGEGFGIGLAYVSQLLQLWGGSLSLESPVSGGRGTRAIARFPLPEASSDEDESELAGDDAEESLVEEEAAGARERILLVEDNADLRRFLSFELGERYAVLQAVDGNAGFEEAVRNDPDLIITDVMMPGCDGFELCRRLRADSRTSHVPIIILTAKSTEKHMVEGIEAGADAYFPKPLNSVRLLARVENLLESRRKLKRIFAERLVIEPTEVTVTSTDEGILRKAIKVVETNMSDETFNVERFAKEMGMSRATLYRKLTALTGEAPNPFIRTMRLKRAAQMLKTGRTTVSGVLEHVGILDLSYFSRVFKAQFGESPSEYLAKCREESRGERAREGVGEN